MGSTSYANNGNGILEADGFSGPDQSGVAPGAGSPATFPNGMTIPGGTAIPAGSLVSTQDGIVAHAGGGQANATKLTATYSRIITVATAADSVELMAAVVGARQVVRNDGANAAAVFPATGGTINAAGANASVSLAAGDQSEFVCYTAGAWHGPIAEV